VRSNTQAYPRFLDFPCERRRPLPARPSRLDRIRRQNQHYQIALLKTLVDLRHEVIAMLDIDLTPPRIDAVRPQFSRQRLDEFFVLGAVREKELHELTNECATSSG
jgi:hypothetical protein